MATSTLDAQIRERIESFISQLSELIKRAAVDSVREAFGSEAALATARRRPGAPRKKAMRRRGPGSRRSSADVDSTAEALLNEVRSNPGQGINELSASLGISPKELRLPVLKMIGDGRLKTTGQKRGTKYHAGSGRAPSKKRKARRRRARAK
jgi:hypothetical protein